MLHDNAQYFNICELMSHHFMLFYITILKFNIDSYDININLFL